MKKQLTFILAILLIPLFSFAELNKRQFSKADLEMLLQKLDIKFTKIRGSKKGKIIYKHDSYMGDYHGNNVRKIRVREVTKFSIFESSNKQVDQLVDSLSKERIKCHGTDCKATMESYRIDEKFVYRITCCRNIAHIVFDEEDETCILLKYEGWNSH